MYSMKTTAAPHFHDPSVQKMAEAASSRFFYMRSFSSLIFRNCHFVMNLGVLPKTANPWATTPTPQPKNGQIAHQTSGVVNQLTANSATFTSTKTTKWM